MNTTAVKLPPYNLLSALQKAQTTLEHYNVGGTLVIDSDQLEAAEAAVTTAKELLTDIYDIVQQDDEWGDAVFSIAKAMSTRGISLRAKNDDAGLTAVELADKYAGEAGTQSEHPAFSASDWQAAVWDNHTRVGYWDWVVEQIASSSSCSPDEGFGGLHPALS